MNVCKTRSLPAWECGLKCHSENENDQEAAVTPCVGVWIEIGSVCSVSGKHRSLPAWECGLKLSASVIVARASGHSLRGSVD